MRALAVSTPPRSFSRGFYYRSPLLIDLKGCALHFFTALLFFFFGLRGFLFRNSPFTDVEELFVLSFAPFQSFGSFPPFPRGRNNPSSGASRPFFSSVQMGTGFFSRLPILLLLVVVSLFSTEDDKETAPLKGNLSTAVRRNALESYPL